MRGKKTQLFDTRAIMTHGMSHAVAVRQAILAAQRDNQRWLQAEHTAAATAATAATTDAPGDSDVPMYTCKTTQPAERIDTYEHATRSKTTKAIYTNVSSRVDILMGFRIGTKLIIIDDQKNKFSDIVQAIDGLIQKAKRLADADPNKPLSVSTQVEGSISVMLEATPTAKGLKTVLYYTDGMTKTEIEPIGVVNWFLG